MNIFKDEREVHLTYSKRALDGVWPWFWSVWYESPHLDTTMKILIKTRRMMWDMLMWKFSSWWLSLDTLMLDLLDLLREGERWYLPRRRKIEVDWVFIEFYSVYSPLINPLSLRSGENMNQLFRLDSKINPNMDSTLCSPISWFGSLVTSRGH